MERKGEKWREKIGFYSRKNECICSHKLGFDLITYEVCNMEKINWSQIPDVLSKEDLRCLCHISKATALYLLKTGLIPSENTGKKTRCYKIKKTDVQYYLQNREVDPMLYALPEGWRTNQGLSIEMREYLSRTASALKVVHDIKWNELPSLLDVNQVCSVCNMKPLYLAYLLESGFIPYQNAPSFIYEMKKKDIKSFLLLYSLHPRQYRVPLDWYKHEGKPCYDGNMSSKEISGMKKYFTHMLKAYKDLMTVDEIVKLTGFVKKTVNRWCAEGTIKHVKVGRQNFVPKIILVEFLCSKELLSTAKKSPWYIFALRENKKKADN